AERSTGFDHVQVDPIGAGPDLAGDLHATLGVSGPHGSGEAVVAVVGDADRLRLIRIGDDAQNRAEYLLAGDAHLRVHVGEHGGRDVPAAFPARGMGAPGDDLRPLVLPDRDVVLHPVLLPPRDQRPNLRRRIGRVAYRQPAHHGRERVHGFVVTTA